MRRVRPAAGPGSRRVRARSWRTRHRYRVWYFAIQSVLRGVEQHVTQLSHPFKQGRLVNVGRGQVMQQLAVLFGRISLLLNQVLIPWVDEFFPDTVQVRD